MLPFLVGLLAYVAGWTPPHRLRRGPRVTKDAGR